MSFSRCLALGLLFGSLLTSSLRAEQPASTQPTAFQKLPTEPFRGKQDDLFFTSPDRGWYVNGLGRIFSTTDGGQTWTKLLDQPGTYFRCIGMIDDQVGVAGNIGTDYFPGVTDTTPIYRTTDGGTTWTPIKVDVVGLCSIDILREQFINAGKLDTFTRIYAGGRVGGPAQLIYSDDLGLTWTPITLPADIGPLLDVHFFDRRHGIVAAGTSTDTAQSNALILSTSDGGKTWTRVFQSTRPFEITWKISFPTRETGYVTIQSYDPDPASSKRYIAKTTDGGKTWVELPLIDEHAFRAFGVGFVTADHGFVGGMNKGLETRDGGATWQPVRFGNAVNKIRVLHHPGGVSLFTVGVDLYRADLPK
jgi:photosystem II stability/assembly factor-like uncharacterized protein